MELRPAPAHYSSSCLEKVLEHRLLAEITTELWLRGIRDFEVLRGEVDAYGYDLVLEANGVLRHIQLKTMGSGGKRRHVGVSLALAGKPSGCVIWMNYDPETLELGPFLWFGGAPGEPLPCLGERMVRHSKGNAQGIKAERSEHRRVPRSSFDALPTIASMVDMLFEPRTQTASDQIGLVKKQIARSDASHRPDWLARVRAGDFTAIPEDLTWDTSVELAHLIDGYRLVPRAGWGDPFRFAEERLQRATEQGSWDGGPAELWACLFLEQRRWRMSAFSPGPEQHHLLNRLCQQLRHSLLRAGLKGNQLS